MVRVTPLVSAAFLSLTAGEVVLATFQEHLRDVGFLDTCTRIANSISNASAVYYPRRPLFHPILLGQTYLTYTTQRQLSIPQTTRTGQNQVQRSPPAASSQAPLRTLV